MKAITYKENEQTEIYKGVTLYAKKIEPAGRGYVRLQTKVHNRKNGTENVKPLNGVKADSKIFGSKASMNDENIDGMIDEEKMKNKKKRKGSVKMYSGINLYEVLGFDDWGEDFTEKELKKKYRTFALKYHPDKLGKDYDEQAKKKWLKVRIVLI